MQGLLFHEFYVCLVNDW